MESELALILIVNFHYRFDSRVFGKHIASGDDSTMRKHLQHTENNAKGKLQSTIPEPDFLADSSHRIKVMSSPIFTKVTKT